jgi:hypothetical protein
MRRPSQIEEVLICEISDETVEAAGTRTEIAGGVDVCLHRHSVQSPVCTQAMKSPGRGDRGFKDGRGGGRGVFRPSSSCCARYQSSSSCCRGLRGWCLLV